MNSSEVFNSLGIQDKVKVAGNAGVYNVIQSSAYEGSDASCYVLVTNDNGKSVIKVTRAESFKLTLLERFPETHASAPLHRYINRGN